MMRLLQLVVPLFVVAAFPVAAQEREGPRAPSGEIRIPSDAALDTMAGRNAAPNRAKSFSGNDAIAIQQMDERDKRIDREVMKGICTDC